jgi:hypothetical protein
LIKQCYTTICHILYEVQKMIVSVKCIITVLISENVGDLDLENLASPEKVSRWKVHRRIKYVLEKRSRPSKLCCTKGCHQNEVVDLRTCCCRFQTLCYSVL